MNIYEYTPGKPTGLKNAVIALGFFDGVHIAHRELIQRTVEIAKKENLSPLRVHIAVDTGMGRIGYPARTEKEIDEA